jgi:hypothetical protein
MSDTNQISSEAKLPSAGPYIARVVSHLDKTYMGQLQVELLRTGSGNTPSESSLHRVKYMSPFYGVTPETALGIAPDDYNETQKSYGMWMVPPDVGTRVMVIFVDSNPKDGYWIGCIMDEAANFMVPGIAATQKVVEDPEADNAGNLGRVPVAEYNKKAEKTGEDIGEIVVNATNAWKPKHPLADVLIEQGLVFDDSRGITTSSARREIPSMVFGISTPGPVDRRPGAKQAPIGKSEWKIPNAFVSRLGGSTFVMDDGDDKWLRKTTATEGPPEYANLEDGETDGQPDLPHNELIRLRTRTGHQILLHNTEDLIYIGNARGTSWIELSSDGKIDIYAEDSISVHTKQDFNFYADRDFNIEVGRNFNLKVAERHQTEVGMDKICIVNGNVAIQVDGTKDETVTGAVAQSFEATWDVTTGDAVNITTGADLNLNVSGASVVSSSGDFTIKASNTAIDGGNINFNSGIAGDAGTATAATPPEPLTTFENPDEADGTLPESIMLRIPTHEPWPHHENLDPLNFKPEMTDREAGSAIATPDLYKTYSTPLDTFDRQAPPGDEEQ